VTSGRGSPTPPGGREARAAPERPAEEGLAGIEAEGQRIYVAQSARATTNRHGPCALLQSPVPMRRGRLAAGLLLLLLCAGTAGGRLPPVSHEGRPDLGLQRGAG